MSREKFEEWVTAEQWFHGSDFEWDDRRNCYSQFGIHLAYKAWLGATEQAEAKCAALAAENAKAKSVLKQCQEYFIAGIRNEIRPTNEGYLHMICDTFADETPATDAFLAEVRAQGVERYADQLKSEADRAEETGWDGAAKFLRSEFEKINAFAAQLRQEAAQ